MISNSILDTAELDRERISNPLGLAQCPHCPVADGVDVNRQPRKLLLDARGHSQHGSHNLRCADHLHRTLAAQSHVRAHFLVRLERWASRECGGDNGADGDRVAQAEVHALAASRGVDVSGVADETHAGAGGSCFVVTAKVFEEGLRGGVTRAEARRPQYGIKPGSVWVLAAELVRAVLLDQLLAVLH